MPKKRRTKKGVSANPHLDDLEDWVWVSILTQLSLKDVANAAATCKRLYQVVQDNSVLAALLEQEAEQARLAKEAEQAGLAAEQGARNRQPRRRSLCDLCDLCSATVVLSLAICHILASLGINIAAIVIGAQATNTPFETNQCASDSLSLDLSVWLLVAGSVQVTIACCGVRQGFGDAARKFCVSVVTLGVSLFLLSWFVVGIVILSRLPSDSSDSSDGSNSSDEDCASQQPDLFVMSVIELVWMGLSFLLSCLGLYTYHE